MTKRWLSWIFLATLSQGGLRAAENLQNASGFAFPSIQQGAGARAIALGSTYVGIAEGSSTLLWNPAGLANLSCPELALHHNSELVGAFQEVAVLGLPLAYGNGLGLSLNYEDLGSFNGFDSNGASTGTYGDQIFGGSVGWGISVPGALSLGVALKANEQNLAGSGSAGFAGDLGILWNPSSCFSVGAAYNNLGPAVSGQQLAQGLRVGVSSYIDKGGDYQWLLAMSGEALTQGANSLHFGLESTLHQFVALRAGYAVEMANPDTIDTSALTGWTFGGGILLHDFSIDYALVPLSDLGNMQRISLTYVFSSGCVACPQPATSVVEPTPAPVSHTAAPVAPAPVAKAPEPAITELLFTDADFMRVVPKGEDESLSPEAQNRLHGALERVSGVAGASIMINGNTALMLHPYGSKNGPELREIGTRRAKLVSDYFEKKMPDARVSSIIDDGSDKGSPTPIFQVVLR